MQIFQTSCCECGGINLASFSESFLSSDIKWKGNEWNGKDRNRMKWNRVEWNGMELVHNVYNIYECI